MHFHFSWTSSRSLHSRYWVTLCHVRILGGFVRFPLNQPRCHLPLPKVRQSQSAEIYRVSRCEWTKSRAFEIAFNIRFYFRCEATFSACFDKISEVKPHGPRLTVTASYFKWISPNSFARDAINSFGEFIIFPFLSPRACRCDLTPSSRCFVSVCCPFSYIVRGFADGNFHAAEIIFPRSGFRALERLSPGSSKYK